MHGKKSFWSPKIPFGSARRRIGGIRLHHPPGVEHSRILCREGTGNSKPVLAVQLNPSWGCLTSPPLFLFWNSAFSQHIIFFHIISSNCVSLFKIYLCFFSRTYLSFLLVFFFFFSLVKRFDFFSQFEICESSQLCWTCFWQIFFDLSLACPNLIPDCWRSFIWVFPRMVVPPNHPF